MEISPIFSQTAPTAGMEALLWMVGLASGAWLVIDLLVHLARTIDLPDLRLPSLRPLRLMHVGLAAAIPTPGTPATPPVKHTSRHHPPWLGTSGFPPPRPLVRAEASRHPAIHPGVGGTPRERLFPREHGPRRAIDQIDEHIRRGIIDLRRTEARRSGAPQRVTEESRQSHYTVMPGDCLWDIAARVLGTDDVRAIARFWPLIHRENRDVIGADPNLIRPGMVLTLPRKERA